MTRFIPTDYVSRPDPLILEIGANDGEDTRWMLNLFPQAFIHCFEPDPRAIGRFKIQTRNARAILWEIALAHYDGDGPFVPSKGDPPGIQWQNYGDWDKSGSILEPDRHSQYQPWLSFHDPIMVPYLTLDTWISGQFPDNAPIPSNFGPCHLEALTETIDLAWVDVQGAEALVLRGAEETLPRIRYWYCECHNRPYYKAQATIAELDKLLAPRFVRIAEFAGENYLWENKQMEKNE